MHHSLATKPCTVEKPEGSHASILLGEITENLVREDRRTFQSELGPSRFRKPHHFLCYTTILADAVAGCTSCRNNNLLSLMRYRVYTAHGRVTCLTDKIKHTERNTLAWLHDNKDMAGDFVSTLVAPRLLRTFQSSYNIMELVVRKVQNFSRRGSRGHRPKPVIARQHIPRKVTNVSLGFHSKGLQSEYYGVP